MWLSMKEEEMELVERLENDPNLLKKVLLDNGLGHIADKYESGESKTDSGTISNLHGDPGGKSYGVYQLSSAAGTLKRYIEQSKYKEYLSGIPLGIKEFDIAWLELADKDQEGFAYDQFDFIRKSHYLPAAKYAVMQGYAMDTRAIQEAIFSISVQHRGYRVVIHNARRYRTEKTIESQVKALYRARTEYVRGLKSLSDKIKESVLNRYVHEEADVLKLV